MRATIDSGLGSWWAATGPLVRQRILAARRWWAAELGQLMPERIRQLIADRQRKIYLLPRGSELAVLEGTPGQLVDRGRKPLEESSDLLVLLGNNDEEVMLLLPPEQLLTKTIVLPAGASEDLAGALEMEMDRQTPFAADKVYFDYSIRECSSARKTITVDLILTPRARLDPLLSLLAAAGLVPTAVKGIDADDNFLEGDLLPKNRRPPRPRVFNRLNTVLAVITLALLVTAAAIPVIKKQAAIAALEQRAAAAMEAAREASAIRQNIERLTAGTAALIARKDAEPGTIELLDALTKVIPDHTWIEQVEIRGSEVQLRGQSPSAAGMITLFESSEAFGDPRFQSSVTQVQNSDREKFHISVSWKGAEQ